ncbi:hypothetical protein [Embleya sp. AB8]|uniref:hypothetical protein n=1 Tax=Embleya sp. AB8 TaxID=3156304 RepID=UPI003C758CCF
MGALDAEGAFPSPWVREAMLAVPRAAFTPDRVWRTGLATGRYTAVDRYTPPRSPTGSPARGSPGPTPAR